MPKPQDGCFILTQIYSLHHKTLMLKIFYEGSCLFFTRYTVDSEIYFTYILLSSAYKKKKKKNGNGNTLNVVVSGSGFKTRKIYNYVI